MVPASAAEDPVGDRQPGAHAALEEPQWREGRGPGGEEDPAAGPAPPGLGHDDRRSRRGGNGRPASTDCAGHGDRHHEEHAGQTRRLGQVVVGLAPALGPEAAGGRREPPDETVEGGRDPAAPGFDRADQFEVLEEQVAVISVRDRAAADGQGAGVVPTGHPVEEGARGVPGGVPGARSEVVLWPDELGVVEESDHAFQVRGFVAHVVVGDDDPVVAGEPQPGQHPGDLAVQDHRLGVGPDVAQREPGPMLRPAVGHGGVGAVDDDEVDEPPEPVQVAGQLVGGRFVRSPEREDVRGLEPASG